MYNLKAKYLHIRDNRQRHPDPHTLGGHCENRKHTDRDPCWYGVNVNPEGHP